MNKKLFIADLIEEELEKFISLYHESTYSSNERVQEIINYAFKTDGKKIRPILLLLAAKACGQVNYTTYMSAVTIELLHTASLIHDDVVDESNIRRGKPSLNAIYDNKIAVLAGDYFLSTALIKSVNTGNIDIITSISKLGRNLAEGELNQLSMAKQVIIDESQYLDVIKNKTASLLSVCMRIGAISVKASSEQVRDFTSLGENFGMCFQLKDDIFDYYSNDIGKPTGNDIREGKITLPLLYALRNSTSDFKNQAYKIINDSNFTEENISFLVDFAKNEGGIDYTYKMIDKYKNDSLKLIDKMEKSDIKDSLLKTLDYIINRSY